MAVGGHAFSKQKESSANDFISPPRLAFFQRRRQEAFGPIGYTVQPADREDEHSIRNYDFLASAFISHLADCHAIDGEQDHAIDANRRSTRQGAVGV